MCYLDLIFCQILLRNVENLPDQFRVAEAESRISEHSKKFSRPQELRFESRAENPPQGDRVLKGDAMIESEEEKIFLESNQILQQEVRAFDRKT